MIAKTILYSDHVALTANMVDFHGWSMPLHYGSQLEEHHQVRQNAGMFDVSHMNVVDVFGAGSRQFLRQLLANDIDTLSHNGQGLYSLMCSAQGGIVDDLIVYQQRQDQYRLVLNAATRAKDMAWIAQCIHGHTAHIQERFDYSMIAVQGPKAVEKTLSVLTPCQVDAVSTLTHFESVEAEPYFFARTGYTGEDGLEIIAPHESILELWRQLLAAGVKPCGLGARDTLRIEAGFMLYGQDMDESTTPLESGLSWTIKWTSEHRHFIGMGALMSQKQQGASRKLVGLILDDKVVMRPGQKVRGEGLAEGIITSGTFSPTLGKSIAFARVPIAIKDQATVEIRGKPYLAKVTKTRFLNMRTVS